MKKCNRCKNVKTLNDFFGNCKSKDGKMTTCKQCIQAHAREFNVRFQYAFKNIANRIKNHARYKNIESSVTWEEFQTLKTQFSKVYKDWVDSSYDRKLSPVVDRIDSSKGYHLNNIQIISFSENAAKDIRGEKQYSAKLGTLEVETIRWLKSNYDFTNIQLGRMFGVSNVHIGYIIKRTKWQHI